MVVMKSLANRNGHAQKGGALIIMALILLLAGTTALFTVLNGNGVQIERDKRTATILADAKIALIGLSIKAVSAGTRPGNLIIPDALSESSPDYDGTADGGCLDVTKILTNGLPLINSDINMRCLGRLPWKDLGISIHAPSKSIPSDKDPSESDVSGIMPWYAVSANLVDPTCLAVLNSNTLNLTITNPPPATLDCTGATLPYPWLTVRDNSGNIVSNRVAAAIFVPGAVRGTQSRSSTSLSAASQYLDTLVVPTGCATPCVPGTYSNADMDNDFIMASESMPLAMTSNFNDQLVYITIDELMAAVEKRVAQEATSQLRSYYLASSVTPANRFYPYAANLGYQGQSCVQGLNSGSLPLPICNCSGSKCDCAFPATIKFTSDQNYSLNNGACTYTAKVCSCTGLGSCARVSTPKRNLICSGTGTCVSNVAGTFNYTPSLPIDSTSMSGSGSCAVVGATATCSGAGNVSVDGSTNQCAQPQLTINSFPAWFSENGWKHFIYYAKGNLTVGTSGASSLVVSSGSTLIGQVRPSNQIQDYLDKPAPAPYGVTIFDAIGTPRTSTYNDQMFIVAP